MTEHRYPGRSLVGDYLRGGSGLVITCAMLVMANMLSVFQYIMIGLVLLFAGFVLRTLQRHLTVYSVSDAGLRARGPLGREIAWSDLTDLRLRYFATRRDRKAGWFQLTLRSSSAKLSLDSELDDFDTVLEHAADAARRNRLALSEATTENLASTGFAVEPASRVDTPPEPA